MSSKTLKEFLLGQACLIVEPSPAFSSSIHTCLLEFGVSGSQILIARRFEDAKKIIRDKKPKVIISEYQVGTGYGLSLFEIQSEYLPDELSRISIIVTKNSADSSIAEAAEEQIDAYILKPFSVDSFRQKINEVFTKKINPTAYMQKIREGKEHYFLSEFEEAVVDFLGAKPLDEKPTLACFYAGQAYQKLGDKNKALAEFKEGRRYHPLHYKCLIGEFEMYIEGQKYPEAYELMKVLRDNYPVTSHRLGQFFMAAVFTYHFDDLPLLYQIYLKLEQRPERLVHLTTVALMTAGKYWVKNKSLSKAVECFEMCVMVSGRKLTQIEAIINIFLGVNAVKEAKAFFSRVLPADIGTAQCNRLEFKIDQFALPKNQAIEKGRKLVTAGQATPETYVILIQLLVQDGKTVLAEAMIEIALAAHPEMRAQLYAILEKSEAL